MRVEEKIMLCKVFRGVSDEGRFLYLRNDLTLQDLPEDMLKALGKLREALTIDLSKVEKLMQVEVSKLKSILEKEGYYIYIQDLEDVEKKIAEVLIKSTV